MQKEFINLVREHFNNKEFIPLHAPAFIGNEKKYLENCIDSNYVSSVGSYVDKFETLMNQITKTNRTTAVVNGTSALQVALRLVGVKENDEVITQALTFVATANAIAYNNAFPIFIDVDLDTMGLSPSAVNDFLDEFGELRADGCYNKSTGRKISACLPMHTFGFPVHLDQLVAVCKKWKIPLVEDAAESLGSQYKGKPTGSFGKLGAFSFNGNKLVTSGGGGAIVTNDIQLGNKAKFLTTTAKSPHPYEYFHVELGYNFRMPNLNAALACAQLENLQLFLKNKRSLAEKYENFFSKKGVNFRTETEGTKSNYWLMCIELESKKERDLFLKTSNDFGVMTRPIWQLMYRLPMYKECQIDEQKNAKYLEERIVNIPSSYRHYE